MPIIPRVDEAQVISSGSPVPISGTGEARMLASATDQFADALVKLGSSVAAIDKESKRQRERLRADIAGSDIDSQFLVLGESLKQNEEYGKEDAAKTLEKYKAEANKLIEAQASTISDVGNERLLFLKDAKDKLAQHSVSFYSNAVKDYNKVTSLELDKFISREAVKASNSLNPNDLYNSLAHTHAKINEYSFLSNDEKVKLVSDSRKEIMSSFIDGHVAKIMSSDNPYERNYIEKQALNLFKIQYQQREDGKVAPSIGVAGIFSDKEREHLYNKITEARWKADNRDISMQQALEARDARDIKKKSESTFRSLGVEIFSNVKDANSMNLAIRRIDDAAARGDLDPRKADDLKKMAGARTYYSMRSEEVTADSLYIEKFADDLLNDSDHNKSVSNAYDAIDRYNVNATTAVNLMNSADKVAKAMQKDPSIRANVKEAINRMNRPLSWPGYKSLKREDQIKVDMAIGNARRKLYNSLLENPNFDIDKAHKNLINSEIVPIVEKLKIMPKVQPVDVDTQVKKLLDEADKKRKAGKLTKEEESSYVRKVKELHNSKKQGDE